ncbi:MAG: SUMF1/EgtB/PvdO family nonheme iron enzyme [Bacteroidota bacterium]
MNKLTGLLLTALVLSFSVSANNMQISNISTSQVNGSIVINFNLSWENSWRTASTGNYDGAWVFFKFKDNDGKWKPIRFSGTNNTAPAGYTVDISNNGSNNGIGAFVYRSNLGFGNVALTNIRAGIEPLPGIFDVKGFAIEMVYVPQGSFYVGDSTGIAGAAYQLGNTIGPYKVYGVGSTVTLGIGASDLSGENEQTLNGNLTNFPVGYNAFWIMKYEVSQGGWRDYFNTLTFIQQNNRGITSGQNPGDLLSRGGTRGRIELISQGSFLTSPHSPAIVGCDFDNDGIYNEPSDGEWIAMSNLNWPDVASYLDWAGLRPMTELEYEKACRGPVRVKQNEYAWGTPNISSSVYTLINEGLNNEAISNSSSTEGNALFSIGNVRGGLFATAFSSRISSGASYYGVMELSGNAAELCVTTWNLAGRSFTGKQGDGILSATAAFADEISWPGMNGNGTTTTANGEATPISGGCSGVAGIIIRGGHYVSGNAISKRYTPLSGINGAIPARVLEYGIRGVRDAN